MAALLVKLHLLASLLNLCMYAAKDSLSFCWMSMKWLTEVWMSELQILRWRKSLISSQHLPEVRTSVTKLWVKPFHLACASLVLLSSVRSAVVSISTNQSSNCIESLPLEVVISWISVFAKVVCFWAEHNVSMYCCSTSSRGFSGAEEQNTRDNLWSSCSRRFMASVGWPLAFSTLCCKSSRFFFWSGPSGWRGFHVPHSLNYPSPHDGNCSEYQYLIHVGYGPYPRVLLHLCGEWP